jgi:hypothetical protein
MQRFLIKCANCAVLVLIVIGIPSITRVEFRGLEIGSDEKLRLLLFWSFALAIGLNLFAGLFLVKSKKERLLCWEWAAVFGVLLFAYCAFVFGYLNFDWLKNFLLRLQSHL